jgi:hypothetical protein
MRIFAFLVGCDRPPPAVPVAKSAIVRHGDLQAPFNLAVQDVLTNPELQESRDFYGTSGDSQAILRVWTPDKLVAPSVPGWNLKLVDDYPPNDPELHRVLGVRLDKIEDDPNDPFAKSIELVLDCAMGSKNGGVIGGARIFYKAQRQNDNWTVQCLGVADPYYFRLTFPLDVNRASRARARKGVRNLFQVGTDS